MSAKSKSRSRGRAPRQPDPPARGTAPAGAALPPRRRWPFRIAALLAPLVILGAIECGLRMAGYGYPTTFFIPAQIQGRAVLIENEKFGWRFFPPEIARSPSPAVIEAAKPPGTFRVFLFGESAALGDPRPAYGVGRYLEVLLRERYPETRFQVIPAAMTAINSHGLRLIARECARLGGDFWIVYMGHNEMEGPFGITNPFGPRAPRLAMVRAGLAFKATRIGQWLSALARRATAPTVQVRAWAGMKTMGERPIPPDDPAKEIIYHNFRRNLEDLVDEGLRAGASVLLSPAACNLRDCPPFASARTEGLDAAVRAEWSNLCARAEAALGEKDPRRTADFLQQALRLDPQAAELRFRLAHCWIALTNEAEARAELVLARDQDALPFRADSRLNTIVQEVAREQAGRGVRWFDAAAALGEGQPARSPGSEAFLEHVHLNFDGNYRLALALASEVEKGLPPSLQAGRRPDWASADLCDRRLALTDWNRFAVYESILARLQDAPFTNRTDNFRQARQLQTRMVEWKSALQPQNYMDARAIYDEAIALAPKDFRLHENYAEFLEATGEFAEAQQQWEQVRHLIPHHCLPYYHLARMQALQGKHTDAASNLSQALALRPDFVEARLELGRNFARQGKPDLARTEYEAVLKQRPDNAGAYVRLADLLATQGKRSEGIAALREAVRANPNHWEAHYLLGVELVVLENVQEAADHFATAIRLRPDHALAHLNYAIALAKLNQLGPALHHFRETLRLDPSNAKAADYLRVVEAAARPAGPGDTSGSRP